MKTFALFVAVALGIAASSEASLVLTSIYDGQSSEPKGVELYVVESGNFDGWTLETQANASTGSFSIGYTFDTTEYIAGDFIYVTSTSSWGGFSGLPNVIADGSFNQNGDDRIRLTDGTATIDQFGVTGVDGSGEDWEYTDSYAYRNDLTMASGGFVIADWTIAPPNTLDGGNGPLEAALGTYSAIPEPTAALFGSLLAVGLGTTVARRRNEG